MKPLHCRFILCCGVAISTLALVQHAGADSFTIPNGVTAFGTQILNTPGDVGTVEAGGAISTGGIGIQATADGVTINNAGQIVSGNTAIFALNNNTITNSGEVTAAVASIFVNDYNTITNSGEATGEIVGILASNNNTITNSGTAEGTGVGGTGISASSYNTITNSGEVTGGWYGIHAYNNNTVTNSGTVTGGLVGIYAYNNNTVTNTGIAQSDGYGIGVNDFNTIISSGMISGNTAAVLLAGIDNTLRLQAGSTIIGALELGDVSNKLIIDPGLDTALYYTGGTIDTGGQPYVITGSTLYVVNTTGFAAQAGLANDLTRIVAGAVEDRLAAARLAGEGLSTRIDGTTVTATADLPAAAQSGVWLSGLGSYRDQKAGGITTDYTTAQGGVVGGFDATLSDNTRAGIFAGLSLARLDDGAGSQDLDSHSYFGGLYLGHDMGQSFVDLSVLAGWMDFDSDRRIANNMVPGGVEHATADYGGFLVSPALKFGTDMEMGSGILTPSIRLRYTGLVLDGYSESGSSADMVVDGRTVNVVDVRGELAYRFAPVETGGGLLNQTLRVGVDGIFSDAGGIDATLAGQAVGFNVPDGDVVRGFVGYGIDYALASNASLSLSTEAGYDSDEALTIDARAALTLAF